MERGQTVTTLVTGERIGANKKKEPGKIRAKGGERKIEVGGKRLNHLPYA